MTGLNNNALWHRRARYQLQREPLCAWCLRESKVVPARIADHIEPHHNDPHKFWTGALQSLCAHCHESKKKFVERCAYDKTIGPDGMQLP
jgi:5-methylcytosine-specific restriction enzyme A